MCGFVKVSYTEILRFLYSKTDIIEMILEEQQSIQSDTRAE